MVVNKRLELYCSIVTSVTSWALILTLIRFASTALAPLYGRNGVTSAGIDKDGWTGQDGTGPSDSGQGDTADADAGFDYCVGSYYIKVANCE